MFIKPGMSCIFPPEGTCTVFVGLFSYVPFSPLNVTVIFFSDQPAVSVISPSTESPAV